MNILSLNEYKQLIANELDISKLWTNVHFQDDAQNRIVSYWCALVRYNDLFFFVSSIQSDKWEKGFVVVNNSDKSFITSCEVLEHLTVTEKLHQVDIYPDIKSHSTSHTVFNITFEIKTGESLCHFGTSGKIVNENLRGLASALLAATHLIAQNGHNQNVKDLLRDVPDSY